MNRPIHPEEIRQAFSRIPKPLREFMAEGELNDIAQKLAQKYQLHVDATGTLVQLMTMTLLGFISPAQLPQELSIALGLPSDQLSEFIKEINTQIFIPLQKRVREFGTEPTHDERVRADTDAMSDMRRAQIESNPPTTFRSSPPSPSIPAMRVAPPATPLPSTAATASVAPAYNLIQPNAPSATASTPVQAAAPASIPMPTIRTMQHDVDSLQHGEMPLPFQKPLPSTPPSMPLASQMTPAMGFQTASVPFTSTPLAPRQAALPELTPSTPVALPPPPPMQQTPAPAPRVPQIAQVKASSSDPYREPI